MKKIKFSSRLMILPDTNPVLLVTMHHSHAEAISKWADLRKTPDLMLGGSFGAHHFTLRSSSTFWDFAESVGYGDSIKCVEFAIPALPTQLFSIRGAGLDALRKYEGTGVGIVSMSAIKVWGLSHTDTKHLWDGTPMFGEGSDQFAIVDDDLHTKFMLMGRGISHMFVPGVEPITLSAIHTPEEYRDMFHVIQRYWSGSGQGPYINIPELAR